MDKETLENLRERLEEDFKDFVEKYDPDEESNDYPNTPKDITFFSPRKIYAAILFLDLRGFTAWLDGKTKMVSAVKVLYPYFRLAANTIKSHDGSIEKFTGDGIMAVLGAPEGDVTACKNALECAIDIAAVLDHALNPFLAEKKLDTIEWAIGIEYGLNYVTKAGAYNKDGKVYNLLNSVSKAANHASKIECETPPGKILVGEKLYNTIDKDDELQKEFEFFKEVTGVKTYLFKKRWEPEEEEAKMTNWQEILSNIRDKNRSTLVTGPSGSLYRTDKVPSTLGNRPQPWRRHGR